MMTFYRPWVSAALICVGLSPFGAALAVTNTYYVNSNSSVASPSGSLSAPYTSLGQLPVTLNPGDVVNLARGSIFKETLVVRAGVNYYAYSPINSTNSDKPILQGISNTVPVSGWKAAATGNGVYELKLTGLTKVGQVLIQDSANAKVLHRLDRANYFKPAQYAAITSDPSDSCSSLSSSTTPSEVKNLLGGRYAKILGGDDTTVTIDPIPNAQNIIGADIYIKDNSSHSQAFKVMAATIGQNSVSVTLAGKLSTTAPTGWGYRLENQRWMLNQAAAINQWFFDEATNTLSVHLPNGAVPANDQIWYSSMSETAVGIIANGVSNFSLNNIAVRGMPSDGVRITGASSFNLNGLDVSLSGGRGISVLKSTGGMIQASLIEDSAHEGIWLGESRPMDSGKDFSSGVNLLSNFVYRSGLSEFSWGAIFGGDGGQYIGNVIDYAGNHGIYVYKNTTLDGNVIKNTCLAHDDCGAIYAIGRNGQVVEKDANSNPIPKGLETFGYTVGVKIQNNEIICAFGGQDGKANANPDERAATGIYLDDYTTGVDVKNNYVSSADIGIMLHHARYNNVTGNKIYLPRMAGAIFLEDADADKLPCPIHDDRLGCKPGEAYMMSNSFKGNTILPSRNAKALKLADDYYSGQGTRGFASFEANNYGLIGSDEFAQDRAILVSGQSAQDDRSLTFEAWFAEGRENALSPSKKYIQHMPVWTTAGGPALFTVNADFETTLSSGILGWTALYGFDVETLSVALSAECFQGAHGNCLKVKPINTGSQDEHSPSGMTRKSVISSYDQYDATHPDAQLQAGQTYLVQFNAKTPDNRSGARVGVSLINTGSYGWGPVTNTVLLRVGAQASQYHAILQIPRFTAQAALATKPSLRFEFEGDAGKPFYIDDVKVTRVNSDLGEGLAYSIYNTSALSAAPVNCPPLAGYTNANCPYANLTGGTAKTFPITLDGKETLILYRKDGVYLDGDKDGIADIGLNGVKDNCLTSTGTGNTSGVGATGCSAP